MGSFITMIHYHASRMITYHKPNTYHHCIVKTLSMYITFRSKCILRMVNFEKYKLGNVTILMKILQNDLKQGFKNKILAL